MWKILLVAIIVILILIGFFWYGIKKDKERKERNAIILKNNHNQVKERKEAEELALKEKYGVCSRSYDNIGISIRAYDSLRTILLDGKEFSYDEITGCTISDEVTIIPGSSTTTRYTKTNGSVFGRALVGAIIAGTAGALIGGATAREETIIETFTTPDTEKHKYYVTIGISREGHPDFIYDTNFIDRANEVKKLIDTILSLK